jgi:hypothetical protein
MVVFILDRFALSFQKAKQLVEAERSYKQLVEFLCDSQVARIAPKSLLLGALKTWAYFVGNKVI